MSTYPRILVTGATGFLGRHVVPVLQDELDSEIISVGREDYDLLVSSQVTQMLTDTHPDAVIHLAAKVGGIIANAKYPADFYYENVMISTQIFDACYRAGIKKFLTFMGGCSYPSNAPSPIVEETMWDGFPQLEGAPYSIAKKVILVQSASYRKQYGFNSVVLVPGNIYGEFDNFRIEESHVIAAMIRRFVEAKENKSSSVTCYGSGRPNRDFVYAGDVAKLVPWFLEHYDSSEPVNISSGTRISVKALAETVKHTVGYEGTIEWDTSKPDGQMDKIFSVQRLHDLGLSCDTSLENGLRKTIEWFRDARKEEAVRV